MIHRNFGEGILTFWTSCGGTEGGAGAGFGPGDDSERSRGSELIYMGIQRSGADFRGDPEDQS